MQTEMNELKAKHQDELLALRSELDDTVDEFSTLSYNSRAVRVFDSILHDLLCYFQACSGTAQISRFILVENINKYQVSQS